MTRITLHGMSQATCARRVALICKERNIPYTFKPVDVLGGEHKTAAYKEHHPFGQVPYISQDDGFELFESRAICRYLSTQGSGPALLPTDSEPIKRAKFEQAASIEYQQFDPIVNLLAYEKVFKLHYGKKTDEPLVEELLERLADKLDAYEVILSKQKYLAGNEITLADLFHLPYGTMIFEQLKLGEIEKRPNVYRWWKDITSRPSWQAVKNGA